MTERKKEKKIQVQIRETRPDIETHRTQREENNNDKQQTQGKRKLEMTKKKINKRQSEGIDDIEPQRTQGKENNNDKQQTQGKRKNYK